MSHRIVGQPTEGRAGRVSERKTINTGRNLPVAIAVGVGLGAVVLVTLLTVKVTFLILVAVIVGTAGAELTRVLATRQIKIAGDSHRCRRRADVRPRLLAGAQGHAGRACRDVHRRARLAAVRRGSRIRA